MQSTSRTPLRYKDWTNECPMAAQAKSDKIPVFLFVLSVRSVVDYFF